MRVLDGDQFLVRIFLGESDRWRHTPLSRALFERLRAEGFAGVTVVHGVAGFGAHSIIHTAGLIELSADLPVVIEVVDDQAHVDRLLPILDKMITGGALVTVERARVLRYAAGPKREPEYESFGERMLNRLTQRTRAANPMITNAPVIARAAPNTSALLGICRSTIHSHARDTAI